MGWKFGHAEARTTGLSSRMLRLSAVHPDQEGLIRDRMDRKRVALTAAIETELPAFVSSGWPEVRLDNRAMADEASRLHHSSRAVAPRHAGLREQ